MELSKKDIEYIKFLNSNHSKRKIPFVEVINNKLVFRNQQEEVLEEKNND